MARCVQVPGAIEPHGHSQGENASFPLGMEDRLVLFRFDRAEAGHPTHVMYAIHVNFPSVSALRQNPNTRPIQGQ